MTVLDSFMLMSNLEVTDIEVYKDITDILDKWTPFTYKYNREQSEEARNDAFLKAIDKRHLELLSLEKYLVKSIGYFKKNNRIKKRIALIENIEDYVSNERKVLGKDTIDSLMLPEDALSEIEDFINNSELVEILEYLLLEYSKDFVFLMEELIKKKEDILNYRISGIPKRDIEKYFENPAFMNMLQDISYLTTGFFNILIFYYTKYKDFYKSVSHREVNDKRNYPVSTYTNTLCYIIDDTVYNTSSRRNTFILNREKLVNEVFDLLFKEEDRGDMEYPCERGTFYLLLDNHFYYGDEDFESMVKTQIRNIILDNYADKKLKYAGETGDYDIFVSKEEDLPSFEVSFGLAKIKFELEKL